jgi:hypothetical protein
MQTGILRIHCEVRAHILYTVQNVSTEKHNRTSQIVSLTLCLFLSAATEMKTMQILSTNMCDANANA